MKISRGLAALILTICFQTIVSAEYLYKDELIYNPKFNAEVEKLGTELHSKTGIALKLIMLSKLPHDKNIVEYQREILKDFSEPTILLTFSELDSQVDILANDASLYEYFDKKQVLSPVASPVQAFLMAVLYSNSFETFKEMMSDSDGTILPLLAGKAKDGETLGKYSGAMFNGYTDIAEQIAISKNIVLENAAGNANKNSILLVKTVFYGFILYALFMYLKRKFYTGREELEQK
ncbi:MAG: 3-dehydroquinate dehydratase [Campylobacterales bacterium]|nr:3-dehydroquinate dehydratase [Campylobacterales bacterium]